MTPRRQRLGLFAAALCALALAACERPVDNLAAQLGCPQALGVDRLLANPQSHVVLLDAQPADRAAAESAAMAIACHAAGRGERVMIGASEEIAAALDRPVRALLRRGAAIDLFRLPAAEAPPARLAVEERERQSGDARAAAAQAALAERADAADRFVLIVDQPDAAAAPVGLAGHTWRPLGARLNQNGAVSLRAEAWRRSGLRITLMGYEDIPERGASHRYDGLVQVGAAPQLSPAASAAASGAR